MIFFMKGVLKMSIDFSEATQTLLPLFETCIPWAIAWGLGTKALNIVVNVICGRGLDI